MQIGTIMDNEIVNFTEKSHIELVSSETFLLETLIYIKQFPTRAHSME